MSQLFESAFRCGDGDALVTYVYGESSAAERDAISTHLTQCGVCAEEVAALGATREQLVAWTPPAQTLGFRITRSDVAATVPDDTPRGATVLRPAAWWSRPLPAWAQVAAAVLIFASGMAIGMARSASTASAPEATSAVNSAPAAVHTSVTAPGVTREELAQVEQRLRGELAQVRTGSSMPAGGGDRGMLQRVSQMIAESEARQQKELDFRTSVLVSDFANARRTDLANIEKRLGSTSVRVLSNQQDINSLAQRVGYSPGYSPYVP